MAGLVEVIEQVGAAGDLGIVAVAGLHVVDGLLEQLSGEFTSDGGTVLSVFHIAVGSDHMERPGTSVSVQDIIVVGQLFSLDGDGVSHIVHQVDACKSIGGAIQPLLIAHHGVATVAGVAVHAGHLVAVFQQHGENVILGGDGSAIAPHQAIFNGDGVSLGAVLVLSLLVASHDGLVVDELALLGVRYGIITAVNQFIHVVVGLGGREPGVIELVEHVIDGADDQLAGGLSGLFAGLASFGLRGAHL